MKFPKLIPAVYTAVVVGFTLSRSTQTMTLAFEIPHLSVKASIVLVPLCHRRSVRPMISPVLYPTLTEKGSVVIKLSHCGSALAMTLAVEKPALANQYSEIIQFSHDL